MLPVSPCSKRVSCMPQGCQLRIRRSNTYTAYGIHLSIMQAHVSRPGLFHGTQPCLCHQIPSFLKNKHSSVRTVALPLPLPPLLPRTFPRKIFH